MVSATSSIDAKREDQFLLAYRLSLITFKFVFILLEFLVWLRSYGEEFLLANNLPLITKFPLPY